MYRDIKILLVEDDVTLGRLADARLSAKHFQVIRAPDKMTALTLIEKADIMVLDLMLPNGDGKDLLGVWARRLDAGPAMVITGYSVTDDEVPEAWTILRKPFDMDRLVNFVEKYAIVVRGRRCCARVDKMKKQMALQWLAIAALGGVEIAVPLVKFIAGLIPLGGLLP